MLNLKHVYYLVVGTITLFANTPVHSMYSDDEAKTRTHKENDPVAQLKKRKNIITKRLQSSTTEGDNPILHTVIHQGLNEIIDLKKKYQEKLLEEKTAKTRSQTESFWSWCCGSDESSDYKDVITDEITSDMIKSHMEYARKTLNDTVALLLANGANVNARNDTHDCFAGRETPLKMAIHYHAEAEDIIKQLISADADVDTAFNAVYNKPNNKELLQLLLPKLSESKKDRICEEFLTASSRRSHNNLLQIENMVNYNTVISYFINEAKTKKSN